ncbi:MAG: ESPR-type extended signal peptide-containing protein [Stenotrophomonas sp.]
MNRIYRLIWNTALNCWMVASEHTRGRGKQTTRATALVAALVLTSGAWASEPVPEQEEEQLSALVKWWLPQALSTPMSAFAAVPSAASMIAPRNIQYKQQYAKTSDTHYQDSTISGDNLLILGSRSQLGGERSVAYGNGIVANGKNNVAIGDRVSVNYSYNTAVGAQAYAGGGDGATAYGNQAHASGRNAIAIGSAAQVETGGGISGIAIGADSRAGTPGWSGGMAIGGGAVAQYDGIALGHDAKVSASGAIALGRAAVADQANTVSVGNSTVRRRIVNVADGNLSASSTDAVTGKQLFKTNQDVAVVTTTANTAKSTAEAARVDATSALGKANALGGLVAQVAPAGNVRLGGENTGTTLDVRNKSNANRVVSGVANGAITAASNDAVAGRQLFETNQEVGRVKGTAESAGLTATTALNKADALSGLVSQSSATSSVRLGGENTGTSLDVRNKANANRVITGVSDGNVGANSSDAVNGKQLNATNVLLADQGRAVAANAQSISGNRTSIEGNQTGIGTNRGDIASNRTSIGVNRDDIAALRSEFDDFAPDLEGVVTFNEDRTIVDMEGARLTGIRDGDIGSVDSKDAVTGGQLFATNNRVQAIEDNNQFLAVGSSASSERAQAVTRALAVGDGANANASGSLAVGTYATALGVSSVALGRAAYVDEAGEDGFALGTATRVSAKGGLAIGAQTVVDNDAEGSVALGHASVVSERNAVSVGNDGLKRRIINLGRGTADTDATTVAQLRGALGGLGGGAAIDSAGQIIAPEYRIQDSTYANVGDAIGALDSAVVLARTDVSSIENRLNSLFQDESSARTDGPGRLTLGGAQGMVLGNVANGMIAAGSRDAVNGGQLYATNQQVGQNRDAISGLLDELNASSQRGATGLMSADEPSFNFGGARLAGVGAGDISSADSKEAVNGGQLFVTNGRLSAVEDATKYISIGSEEYSSPAFATSTSVAIGSDAKADGDHSTALGRFARAAAHQSVALGNGSYVAENAMFGFALGAYSNVLAEYGMSIGGDTIVSKDAYRSVALGVGSRATEADTVSIGSVGFKRRIVNVANGTADQDAATVGQLKRIASAFGGSIEVDANGNPTAPSFHVQGGNYRSVGDALSALDSSVNDTDKSVGALDNRLNRLFQEETSARTDGPGRLNLGGANGMVLGNVANGMIASGSRDAVNGGQLYEVRKDLQGQIDSLSDRGTERVAISGRMGAPAPMAVDGGGEAIARQDAPVPTSTPVASEAGVPEPVVKAEGEAAVAVGSEGKERSVKHVAKGTADTDAVNVAQLNDVLVRSNEYTDQAVEGLNKRLDGMDKRFNRMAAMSSAQSAMAMNTAGLNTYNRLGAGVGHSDGESALAVGYQRVMNERGSATFSLNGAFTNSGEKTVGVGVGIGW